MPNFETFAEKVELNLEKLVQRNPFVVVALGDFNVKSNNWYRTNQFLKESN